MTAGQQATWWGGGALGNQKGAQSFTSLKAYLGSGQHLKEKEKRQNKDTDALSQNSKLGRVRLHDGSEGLEIGVGILGRKCTLS